MCRRDPVCTYVDTLLCLQVKSIYDVSSVSFQMKDLRIDFFVLSSLPPHLLAEFMSTVKKISFKPELQLNVVVEEKWEL